VDDSIKIIFLKNIKDFFRVPNICINKVDIVDDPLRCDNKSSYIEISRNLAQANHLDNLNSPWILKKKQILKDYSVTGNIYINILKKFNMTINDGVVIEDIKVPRILSVFVYVIDKLTSGHKISVDIFELLIIYYVKKHNSKSQ
jgi:hypothetical protein